jgi:hypothetical protein
MSEAILDLDSISPNENTSAESSGETADSTAVELFPEDPPAGSSADGGGHSESSNAEAFNPDTVDWSRVDPSTVPDQYQPVLKAVKNQQADYTRKMQDLADQRRSQESREVELRRTQGEWADRVQAVAAPQQEMDAVTQLRAQSTEEENKAMDFMDFYVEQRTQQKFAELEGRYNNLLQRVQKSEASLPSINTHIRQQAVDRTNTAVADAVEAHGEDVRNPKWTPEMLRLMSNDSNGPHLNPNTGKPYTVKEAYEKVAGVTASNANALRDANKQTRKGAKNAVRANTSVNASDDGSALTDNEVLSKLQGLGFE